jgi:hypothetical protein
VTTDAPTIRELAAAEADRAEAENPDEETEAAEDEETRPPVEPEPEHEQPTEPPPEPPTQAQMEKMMERLAKEDERHRKRYAEVLGEQFELMQPCPRCLESGHIYPPEVAPLGPDQLAAVDASLGRNVQPELREASDAERCAACDGWGVVLTGAQNEQGKVKPCTPCGGQGWVMPTTSAAGGSSSSSGGAERNGEAADASPVPMPDAWNRPVGHPHWGQDPASVGV